MVTETIGTQLIGQASDLADEMDRIANWLHEELITRVELAQSVEANTQIMQAVEVSVLLARREDGTAIIDGTNEKLRGAQLLAAVRTDTVYVSAEQARQSAQKRINLIDADIECYRLKASFVKSKARLLAAQLEYLGGE